MSYANPRSRSGPPLENEACKPASITREAFKLSRALEFFSEAELNKQIGYPRQLWLLALLKELLDNSVDHCEEIDRLPEIVVALTADSLSVRDNGDGIPASTVESMLDFKSRVSSREAFRCPTRGAQGNAGKCLVAIPYVMNGVGSKTVIEAQGTRHSIQVSLNSLTQEPEVKHIRDAQKVKNGTFVQIDLGKLPSTISPAETARIVLFCQKYAALNPHLTLSVESAGGQYTWERTTTVCTKWTASEAEPAAWYDQASFERLIGARIGKDRAAGRDRLLRDFVREFAGLSGSEALKAVFDEAGLTRRTLASLVKGESLDHKEVAALLSAMKKHGKAPDPDKLGRIGRKHLEHVLAQFGDGQPKYKRLTGFDERGLPFVVETAFAEARTKTIVTGCNFSLSIDRPVVRMLDGLLADQMIDDQAEVTLVVHLFTVAPTFLDRGKSVVDISPILTDAINRCVVGVTEEYRKRRKRAERDADAEARALDRANRRRPDVTLKDAIVAVLEEAIERASGGGLCDFSDRDLYYATRELVQAYTDEPLTQKYFDKVVDDWEKSNGLIPSRQRDPRGFLLEPHTGRRIPLGTKAVEDYEIPAYLYNTILFVEKKGLLSKFQLGQIGEKYDCAIIAAEGYAVRAAKALIHAAQNGHRMKVLCFHDADPYGMNIFRTLSRATGAQSYQIEVIDAGLHLEEALSMGLAVETFTRRKAMSRGLELSELEHEYFTGQSRQVAGKNGKPNLHYINCRRVELNALSAEPARFVAWVEGKLRQYGVASKLIPPKRVIEERGRSQRSGVLAREVEQRLSDGRMLQPIRRGETCFLQQRKPPGADAHLLAATYPRTYQRL